jgi:hypothetical protein
MRYIIASVITGLAIGLLMLTVLYTLWLHVPRVHPVHSAPVGRIAARGGTCHVWAL